MRFLDLLGTLGAKFQLGIQGLILKNTGGKIRARNAADNADAPLVGSTIEASGDSLTLNEDAAGSGADFKITISRPGTGMTEDLVLTLPADKGAAGYTLATDGNGNLSWQSSSTASNLEATDTTDLVFGSSSPLAMFTLPADAVVLKVQVVIDTPFNGAPSLSIGITGTLAKYLASTQVDLTAAAGTVFEVSPGLAANGSSENLIATYAAGAASAGAARLLVTYAIPS